MQILSSKHTENVNNLYLRMKYSIKLFNKTIYNIYMFICMDAFIYIYIYIYIYVGMNNIYNCYHKDAGFVMEVYVWFKFVVFTELK